MTEPPEGTPWPLTREEIHRFEDYGLTVEHFEDFIDGENPTVRRFRVELVKGESSG